MQTFLLVAALAASSAFVSSAYAQTADTPQPPSADAGGPYLTCASEEFALDGSGSSDVDEGTSESGNPPFDTITGYAWELDGIAPFDYDEAAGRSPLVTFPLPGTRDLGLRVTDNTVLAFPTTGQPNLTGDDFASVQVGDCACIGPVAARTKPGKASLVWDPVAGAAGYDILRSVKSSAEQFQTIAAGHVTDYATYLDDALTNGTTYWYRVVPKGADGMPLCAFSQAVAATPTDRRGHIAPVADAGPGQTVTVGDTVTLDGSGSSDGNGDALTFSWQIVTTPGSAAVLSDPTAVMPTFVVDVPGDYVIELVVNDGAVDSASDDVVIVTVDNINDAPAADGQSIVTNEDTPLAIVLTGTDPEGGALTFAILTGPANGQLTGAPPNLMYTPNADFVGADAFSFVSNDGSSNSAPAGVGIVVNPVNDAPLILSIPVPSAREGVPYRYEVIAIDADRGDTLTYSLVTMPVGMTIDASSGLIEWLPDGSQTGPLPVVVRVTDSAGAMAEDSYTLNVLANNPPTAISQTLATEEGVAIDVLLSGADIDGNLLSFEVVRGPDHGRLIGQGPHLVYAPDAYFEGQDSFDFIVSDGRADSAPATVVIDISGGNQPPRIVSEPLTRHVLNPNLDPPEPQLLSTWEFEEWQGAQQPPLWTFDESGFRAIQTRNANFSFLLGAFNPRNVHIEGTWQVNTGSDDDYIGFALGYEGQLQQYLFQWKQNAQGASPRGMRFSVTDPTSDPIRTYLYSNDIPWLDFAEYDYTVDWDAHRGLIRVAVSRDENLVDAFVVRDQTLTSGRFGIMNFSQHQAYYRIWVADRSSDNVYWYDVEANDPDGDDLVYRLVQAPEGAWINPASGTIRWETNVADVGSYPVVVEVEDANGAMARQAYELVVTDGAPLITSVPVEIGFAEETYTYPVAGFDPDPDDALSYSLITGPSGMQIGTQSGLVQWTPTTDDLGSHEVTIEVVDSTGLSDRQTYTLTVEQRPPNEPPVFTSLPLLNATVGNLYTYTPQAFDPDGDVLQFGLIGNPPYHMQIFDGSTITWLPSADQVSDHVIEIDVIDGNGGVDTQTFTITVSDVDGNQPPIIMSEPLTEVQAGELYQTLVEANDPDGDVLTFALEASPPAMTIDSASGLITWQTTPDDSAIHDVVVRVTDARGAFTRQAYSLRVASDLNDPPAIESTPLLTATIDTPYEYVVVASDPDGDALTYTLDTAPTGMMIAPSTGVIAWTPSAADEGIHRVVLEVNDGNGALARQSFGIVVGTVPNSLPAIKSAPIQSATVGTGYAYDVEATDADGDTLTYGLAIAPAGMTMASATGLIAWTPVAADVGAHDVAIEVTDGNGGTASQSYNLFVTLEPNSVPVITSTPVQSAAVDQTYGYDVEAFDPDGEPLTYSLTSMPAGMTIDSSSGLIAWTPSSAQEGVHDIVAEATDPNGAFARQSYTVIVTPLPNDPPVITSDPVQSATVNQAYTYDVEATDPDGDPLTYSLTLAPPGMTIDPASGLVAWIPAAFNVGTHTVRVVVTDGRGHSATQTFTVNVPDALNRAPEIASASPVTAKATVEYVYQVGATDADGDPLTYSLTSAPGGMQIDPVTGRLTWTPASVGVVNVVVRVSDGLAFTEQGWQLGVIDSSIPLDATLYISPTTVDLGGTASITLIAENTAGEFTLSLTVQGSSVPISTDGQASYVTTAVGLHDVVATVTDSTGTVTRTGSFTVTDPGNVTDVPVVSLLTPDFEQEVTSPLDVIGTVTDDNLAGWTLFLLEENAPSADALVLAQDTAEVTDGVLGRIDPTLLLNGLYQVTLQAQDLSGNVASDSRTIRVTGDMKIGHFSITFEDLSVPVAGIPVMVTRTYDSRQRHKKLDFGYGWSIDYQNVRLQESRDVGFSWLITQERFGVFGQTCVRPNGDPTVTVTLPDGQVESFVARAEPECQFVAQPYVTIRFEPIDGTDSTLTQDTFGLIRIINNNLVDPGQPDVPVDPDRYTLTTPEGFVYRLDQTFGIRSIADPHGNTLTYSSNGVTHSRGFALSFIRDGQGRITGIEAPDGTLLSYGYDAAGDLVSFADQVLNTTEYAYVAGAEHYLEDIIDPRGITIARNEYDAEGRLIAHIDADGNRIEYTHAIAGRTETIRDRRGNATLYVYDDEGNVLVETNALGETITRTYDGDRNVLTETNALGHTTTWTYDERGNVLTETNALAEMTTSTHDDRNLLLTLTDPTGNVVLTNVYDTRNTNLLSSTDGLLNTTVFHWDSGIGTCSTGASRGVTNALGDRRVVQPLCVGPLAGLPAWEEDARGVRTTFAYDALGRRSSETTTRTDENGVKHTLVTSFDYDDKGRVIEVTDPAGNVTRTEYNAIDKVAARIDALGRRTDYAYDVRGNLIRTTYPDGTTATSEYDEEGNVTARTDRSGHRTQLVYDAANRVVETIHPDETPGTLFDNPRTVNEYDAAGRLTAVIDENGNRTEYDYDAAGRQILMRDALGNETRHEYDVRGLRTATIDALGRRTEFIYDAVGRLIETVHPVAEPDNRTRSFYDAVGRKFGEVDLAGELTDFEYDAMGNLTAVVDALGQRTGYGYDEQGNKITQTDAEGRVTRWTYDDLGRVTGRVLPLGQTEVFGYDAAGNRTSVTDFNGLTTTTEYDAADRPIRINHGDGRLTTMTYTGRGRIATVTDGRGTTTYTYDVRDRLIQLAQPDGRIIDYAYDPAGNRVALDTANQSITYGYDALNRLGIVVDASGMTTYAYDDVGNRARVSHANGTRAIYTYDDLNRLTELTNEAPAGDLISRHTYTLAPAGNRTAISETLVQPDGTTVTRNTNYSYDALYRLTGEAVTDSKNGNRTTSWTYDAVGNRLTETRTGISAGTTTYSYDANDRLLSETAPGELTTYRYDPAGNTLSKTVNGALVASYGYDSDYRLTEATITEGVTTTTTRYIYDQDGIRQGQTTAGITTLYLVDPNRDYAQVIEEQTGGGINRLYTYGDDLISQIRVGAGTDAYLYDGLGSTRFLTDSSGSVTDTYIYHAFGETEVQNGSTPNDYLYTGEQFDSTLNQYFLRARYYNQQIGRFTQIDTFMGVMHDPVTLHKYLYANADAVNHIDPSGNVSLGQFAVATGVAATLANTAITSYSFGRAARDVDGLPDGVTVSFRFGGARGVGGALGADLVYDFRTGELWGFGAAELSLAPLTAFRPQPKLGLSATAGFAWNMRSPKEFNGAGSTATWPLSTAHLLARASRVSLQTKGGFWGFMTQTAKLAKRNAGYSIQFGFSGFRNDGPAFARIGRGTNFTSDFFGLADGRRIKSTRAPLVHAIEGVMKSLRGSNSPDALDNAIRSIENLK